MMKIIKYKIDIISVLLVCFVVGISILPVFMSLNFISGLALLLCMAFFKPITSLIQHNHVHFSVFNAKVLNVLFDLALSLSTGHISSEWVLHHNIGHHGNAINSLEDTSSVKHPKTRAYMTKMQYIISGSLKIYPDCCKMAWAFYQKKKPRFLIALGLESLFLSAVYLVCLYLNPKMTLIYLILPNLVSRVLVWLGAYWHHLEVPANTPYDATNMYTGPIFNFISLNIGYHIAHHEKPTLHWSLLKARTEQIMDKIPAKHILSKIP